MRGRGRVRPRGPASRPAWSSARGPGCGGGPDGADLELLRVLREERVAQRFTHVVIGSGDGIFAGACRDLVAAGLHVTAMARPGSLSGALRHAADRVVHLPDPVRAPSSEAPLAA